MNVLLSFDARPLLGGSSTDPLNFVFSMHDGCLGLASNAYVPWMALSLLRQDAKAAAPSRNSELPLLYAAWFTEDVETLGKLCCSVIFRSEGDDPWVSKAALTAKGSGPLAASLLRKAPGLGGPCMCAGGQEVFIAMPDFIEVPWEILYCSKALW